MPVITREKLTVSRIEAAKPARTAYRLRDAQVPGLSLRVLPSGLKTYEVHFDRFRSEKLGRHPHMTLEGARTQARARLGSFAQTGERSKPAKAATFGEFISDVYGPWPCRN